MTWRIAGTYLATCSCSLICPCPVDAPPTGPDGECRGSLVFHIREGNLDDTDLSGVDMALWNHWPSNLSAGNWTIGIVVDDGASEEQANALDRIMSGQEGGPFGDLSAFYTDYRGVERASISFSEGDTPSFSVGGAGDVRMEPLRGIDGSPTTVRNAMFGFAPEFQVGKASGSWRLGDHTYEPVYAEAAEFEFASEQAEEAARGRG